MGGRGAGTGKARGVALADRYDAKAAHYADIEKKEASKATDIYNKHYLTASRENPLGGWESNKWMREWQKRGRASRTARAKKESLRVKANNIRHAEEFKKWKAERAAQRHADQRFREITSTTYERARKRWERDFNRWFGRGMEKL